MKTNRLLFLLLAALPAALFAVTYTRQSARVARFQCDPVYDSSGAVTAVPVQAFLAQRLVNDSDPNDVRGADALIPVSFDMIDPAIAATTVTAAGKTVTYQQLAALMRQAVLDRANAAGVQ